MAQPDTAGRVSIDVNVNLRNFYMRHRVGLHDLGILAALFAVLAYVCHAFDVLSPKVKFPQRSRQSSLTKYCCSVSHLQWVC
jgi:hypothetical protein